MAQQAPRWIAVPVRVRAVRGRGPGLTAGAAWTLSRRHISHEENRFGQLGGEIVTETSSFEEWRCLLKLERASCLHPSKVASSMGEIQSLRI